MYTVPHMTHNVTKPLQKCYVCGYNREGEEGGGGGGRERECVYSRHGSEQGAC